MLTLTTRYLARRVATTSVGDLTRPEWPPHPERVYSALVDAFYAGDELESERQALEWLETLPPPQIAVPPATLRRVVTTFVPVNDASSPIKGSGKTQQAHPTAGSLPIGRGRKGRAFPVVLLGDGPGEDSVVYAWPRAEPSAEMRSALDRLAGRTVRVGHSSSLVQASFDQEGPFTPTLVPSEEGAAIRLRIPIRGRLSALDAAFERGQRPSTGVWAGYAVAALVRGTALVPGSCWGELTILRGVEGPSLTLTTTLRVSEALRSTMMKYGPQPTPEVLSGHSAPDLPTARPHVAYVPLGFVGRRHADSHLLGYGVLLPRDLEKEDREMVLATLAAALASGGGRLTLLLGKLGEWTLEPEDRETPPWTLDARTYEGPAKVWASVTPVVLDRYSRKAIEQEKTVALACERIGLPRPESVVLAKTSPLPGVPAASQFPVRRQRYHVHAILSWAEPVGGPIAIGAGRFAGYGLLRPWSPG